MKIWTISWKTIPKMKGKEGRMDGYCTIFASWSSCHLYLGVKSWGPSHYKLQEFLFLSRLKQHHLMKLGAHIDPHDSNFQMSMQSWERKWHTNMYKETGARLRFSGIVKQQVLLGEKFQHHIIWNHLLSISKFCRVTNAKLKWKRIRALHPGSISWPSN
jgi:hypothetical protein